MLGFSAAGEAELEAPHDGYGRSGPPPTDIQRLLAWYQRKAAPAKDYSLVGKTVTDAMRQAILDKAREDVQRNVWGISPKQSWSEYQKAQVKARQDQVKNSRSPTLAQAIEEHAVKQGRKAREARNYNFPTTDQHVTAQALENARMQQTLAQRHGADLSAGVRGGWSDLSFSPNLRGHADLGATLQGAPSTALSGPNIGALNTVSYDDDGMPAYSGPSRGWNAAEYDNLMQQVGALNTASYDDWGMPNYNRSWEADEFGILGRGWDAAEYDNLMQQDNQQPIDSGDWRIPKQRVYWDDRDTAAAF